MCFVCSLPLNASPAKHACNARVVHATHVNCHTGLHWQHAATAAGCTLVHGSTSPLRTEACWQLREHSMQLIRWLYQAKTGIPVVNFTARYASRAGVISAGSPLYPSSSKGNSMQQYFLSPWAELAFFTTGAPPSSTLTAGSGNTHNR
jgi:hypothetical protein